MTDSLVGLRMTVAKVNDNFVQTALNENHGDERTPPDKSAAT